MRGMVPICRLDWAHNWPHVPVPVCGAGPTWVSHAVYTSPSPTGSTWLVGLVQGMFYTGNRVSLGHGLNVELMLSRHWTGPECWIWHVGQVYGPDLDWPQIQCTGPIWFVRCVQCVPLTGFHAACSIPAPAPVHHVQHALAPTRHSKWLLGLVQDVCYIYGQCVGPIWIGSDPACRVGLMPVLVPHVTDAPNWPCMPRAPYALFSATKWALNAAWRVWGYS